MTVYYKFKSAKETNSIAIDGDFISVANLKEQIFESKNLGMGRRTDFDLVVTNGQTNEEYRKGTKIPKNTTVLIQRVPRQRRRRLCIQTSTTVDYNKPEDVHPANSSFLNAESSNPKHDDDSEWDEFGNDLYAIPEVLSVHSTNPVSEAPPPSKADEDSKIKALIDNPTLDWQHQSSDGFGLGRGYRRDMGGRMMGGRGRGGGGLERKTPPQGYICHRCKVPGHFIQHCPTNGDPNFKFKRVKPPIGIPKSMLIAMPDGSYALPSGAIGFLSFLMPNETAFEKEMEGMPSSRPVREFPAELSCPLCKQGMKDAVLTSKCCFKSFCDKCIRDYIISRSACVCGATDILADDLLPNKTLRDTISRLLESNNNNSSAENGGSTFQVQDMESARFPLPKIPSPAQSVSSKGETGGKISASKGEPVLTQNEGTKESFEHDKPAVVVTATAANAPQRSLDKEERELKVADVSEATHEFRRVKEPAASHGNALMANEEVQQKLSEDAGKKKKKKVCSPMNCGVEPWRSPEEFVAENYMSPMCLPRPPYNPPFWNGGMPGGMDGFIGGPYSGHMGPIIPSFGFGPMDPFGNVLPPDPFGPNRYMIPPYMHPQRDMANFGVAINGGHPLMMREEFEVDKAESLRRKRGRSGREI